MKVQELFEDDSHLDGMMSSIPEKGSKWKLVNTKNFAAFRGELSGFYINDNPEVVGKTVKITKVVSHGSMGEEIYFAFVDKFDLNARIELPNGDEKPIVRSSTLQWNMLDEHFLQFFEKV